ncbi:hypothetical protein [Sinosporangium siamense]|uniref:Uncharacterized protein n=1 Tax=Sinosporangium siamense TaxID=1367973 RepID=A0A919RLW8_9ACTN|nr:hypothetical protein [Sinosporangium siamense]GII94374.1 hypothetical protein Ssi02_46050 [Sinosporangium siamense]
MLIPGHHHIMVATADFSAVVHKMAIMTWGIGHKMGCSIDSRLDLANVLALWAGAIGEDALNGAVVAGTFGAMGAAGVAAYGGGTAFATAVAVKIAGKAAGAAAGAITTKVAGKAAGIVANKLASAAMKQVAPALGAKIAAQMGAKHVAGWIPFVGTVVGGGINFWIMSTLADSARAYYREKAKAERG